MAAVTAREEIEEVLLLADQFAARFDEDDEENVDGDADEDWEEEEDDWDEDDEDWDEEEEDEEWEEEWEEDGEEEEF
jgi:hypothetical protein